MNKLGKGLFPYLFWIIVGLAIGVFISFYFLNVIICR